MRSINIIFLLFLSFCCGAQRYDTVNIFRLPIQMDEVVVKASKNGFDVNAFIKRVQTDTTFYKAFKSMKMVPLTAVNDFKVLGKNNEVVASLHAKTKQTVEHNCRTTEFLEKQSTGNFYKRNGDYNYYTAELFAYLFFAPKPECNLSDVVAGAMEERGRGQMEKSKYELKQLMFNPGSKVSGVPFMGEKGSIFDPSQTGKYDFKLTSESYGGQDCYVFKIIPKKGEEKDVVFNELTTWFRKSDYSIVARDYSLSYNTMFYDFDVRMKVRTRQINNKLYPTHIEYDGNWHIISKKRERVKFNVDITY